MLVTRLTYRASYISIVLRILPVTVFKNRICLFSAVLFADVTCIAGVEARSSYLKLVCNSAVDIYVAKCTYGLMKLHLFWK